MNIINECQVLLFIFFAMLTSDNKQTAVTMLHHRQLAVKVNNRASTLRLARVQPRVKRRFVTAHFHALTFMQLPIATDALTTMYRATENLKQHTETRRHNVLMHSAAH